MAVGGQRDGVDPLALPQLRKPALGVVGLTTGELVDGLDVGLEETREGDGAPAGGQGRLASVRGVPGDAQTQGGPAGISHL